MSGTAGAAETVEQPHLLLALVGDGEELHLSGITAGGSQGVLLKFNTWGEKAFLDKLYALVQRWE